jgi:hypothetical protein
MANSTTTGSIMAQGLVPGLPETIMVSGTYSIVSPTFRVVTFNPNNYLTSITGSDIAYAVDTGNFYIGDITLGPGGSKWCRLGSLT